MLYIIFFFFFFLSGDIKPDVIIQIWFYFYSLVNALI